LPGRIVADIRASLNIGATKLAADLLVVLRLALAWRLERASARGRGRGLENRLHRKIKPSPQRFALNAVHFAPECGAPRVSGALRCVRRSGDVHVVRGFPRLRGFIQRCGGVR